MPLFAVLIYADDSAHGAGADRDDRRAHDEHAARLAATDAMVAAYAFTPRAEARSVRPSGTTSGPFLAADEAVAGVYLLEAEDLDAAVAIAGTNPAVAAGGGVEVRPVHSGGQVRAPHD